MTDDRRQVQLHVFRTASSSSSSYSSLPAPPYITLRSEETLRGNCSSLGVCYESPTLVSQAVFSAGRYGQREGLVFNSVTNVQSFSSWVDSEEGGRLEDELPFSVTIDFELKDTSAELVRNDILYMIMAISIPSRYQQASF